MRPTEIVEGAFCASRTAPAATLTFPTTVITASAGSSQYPLTVMLA